MTRREWLPRLWGRDETRTDPFLPLRRQIDALFDDFGMGMMGGFGQLSMPALRINMSETADDFRITADVPGLDKDDIDIEVLGDRLTISGELHSEHTEKDEKEGRAYHRVERQYGTFRRSVTLPFDIDPDKVTADIRNGVLTVTVPKPVEAKTKARKVAIA